MDATQTWHGIDLQWAYGALLRSILRQTRCMHQAQDALHDAFIRYAVTPGRPRVDEPQAYFRIVVRSVLADGHRQALRTASPSTAVDPDNDEDALARGLFHPSAEALCAIRQRLDLLQRLLDALPQTCREVFWLFRVEGHSQAEIAQRLGISVNMVERHTMRALIDLRSAREQWVA